MARGASHCGHNGVSLPLLQCPGERPAQSRCSVVTVRLKGCWRSMASEGKGPYNTNHPPLALPHPKSPQDCQGNGEISGSNHIRRKGAERALSRKTNLLSSWDRAADSVHHLLEDLSRVLRAVGKCWGSPTHCCPHTWMRRLWGAGRHTFQGIPNSQALYSDLRTLWVVLSHPQEPAPGSGSSYT